VLRRRDLPVLLFPLLGIDWQRSPPTSGENAIDWETGRPEDAGFQITELEKLSADIRAARFPNTHAVLVERNGRLIYEQYFAGSDEVWGAGVENRTFVASSLHDLRSASKSVTSALVGIALGRDFGLAVARPVRSFFPNRQIRPELEAVTLHHLLTMTAGFDWNEMTVPYSDPNNDEGRMYSQKDPVGFVLSRPLSHAPGTRWNYCSGLTMVLAGVVQQIARTPFDTFAREALFIPLGITDYEWLGSADTDPRMPSAASGLRLRARDLARFGSVYLHRGQWRGRQIVPAEWVERSMQRQVSVGDLKANSGTTTFTYGMGSEDANWGYGYQWWVGHIGGVDFAAAVGLGNQRVFVVPSEGLVVTIYAGEYNKLGGHSEHLFARILASRTSRHLQ
jgi:CubicO group peptidase (beta-lactamase class C family)